MDLARALAPPPAVGWIIGRVTAVTGDTLTMTYKGGTVTDVGVLDHYIPAIGDVVHVLTSDLNGMVAIGSNNQTTPPVTPTPPPPPITLASTSTATYRISTNTWTVGTVDESPDQVGCWFYPAFDTGVGVGALPLASVTIRLTVSTTAPLEFVLHGNATPAGPIVILGSYRVAAPNAGAATEVPLPLDWGSMLIRGQAMGIGVGGGDYTASLTGSAGQLTFTPLLAPPPLST